MKKFLVFCVTFLHFTSYSQGLDLQWFTTIDNVQQAAQNWPIKAEIDENDNVYTIGYFKGSVDFDPTANTNIIVSSSTEENDLFITKVDTDGNLLWVKTFGNELENIFKDVTIDSLGNVYIAGGSAGWFDYDPGPQEYYIDNSLYPGAFILKLDLNGNFVWVKKINAGINHLKYRKDGKLIVVGGYNSYAELDPGPANYVLTAPSNSSTIYILRLDLNGTFLGEKHFNSGTTNLVTSDISFDQFNNIHIIGGFDFFTDFDPSPNPVIVNATSNYDIFIEKLDPDGNFIWVKTLKGYFDYLIKNLITVDLSGNVYLTGTMSTGNIDFDPGDSIFTVEQNIGDSYILKLNNNGDFSWVKVLKQIQGLSSNHIQSVTTDSNGNIFIGGTFYVSADFDLGSEEHIVTTDFGSNMFLAKYDFNGNLMWVENNRPNSVNYNFKHNLLVDSKDKLLLISSFDLNTDFDFGEEEFMSQITFHQQTYYAKYSNRGYYGYVYNDLDSNCVYDQNDLLLTNQELFLQPGDIQVTTNQYGWFYLDSLDFGAYTFDTDPETSWEITCANSTVLILDSSNLNFSGFVGMENASLCAIPIVTTITENACESYTAPDNQVYTQSGIYQAILQSANGCDSTITINLTIHNNSAATIFETSCSNYTAPDNQIYTQSGTYTAIIPNSSACDSIITINLAIHSNSYNTIFETSCSDYVAPDNQVYSQSGVYVAIIPNTNACDSVITINLTITAIDAGIYSLDTALICNEGNASYQWIDCVTNQNIEGANNVMYVPSTSGQYAVIVTLNGCVEMSECFSFTYVFNPEITLENSDFKLSPNPAKDFVNVELSKENQKFSYQILSLSGQLLIEQKDLITSKHSIDVSNFSSGLYLLTVYSEKEIFYFTIIKD